MCHTRSYNIIPVTSPTTPSAKQLLQHSLTFAVTRSPSRTRTPTSHKAFSNSLSAESPPKPSLSLTKQQTTIEITSVSSTTVETSSEDKQSKITSAKTSDLKQEEGQCHAIRQLDSKTTNNAAQQDTESIAAQNESALSTKDNFNAETRISSPQESPMREKEVDGTSIAPNDKTHEESSYNNPLSQSATQDQASATPHAPSIQSPVIENFEKNEQTINSLPAITQFTRHPQPKSDESSNLDNQNNTSLPNEVKSSSPTVDDNNTFFDSSQSIEQKPLQFSPSPIFQDTQQIDERDNSEKTTINTKTQEEAFEPSVENELFNENEEQPDVSTKALNSSRRSTANNLLTKPRSLTPLSDEPQQQEIKRVLPSAGAIQTPPHDNTKAIQPENELPKETSVSLPSLPKIQQSGLPVFSKPGSSTLLELSDLLAVNEEENRLLMPHTEEPDNVAIETKKHDETTSMIESQGSLSTPDTVNNFEQERQDQLLKSFVNTNNIQDYNHSTNDMPEEGHNQSTLKEVNSPLVVNYNGPNQTWHFEYVPSKSTDDHRRHSQSMEDNVRNLPTYEKTLTSVSILETPLPAQLIRPPSLETDSIEIDSFEHTDTIPQMDVKDKNSLLKSPTDMHTQEQKSLLTAVVTEESTKLDAPLSMIIEDDKENILHTSSSIEQELEQTQTVSLGLQRVEDAASSTSYIISDGRQTDGSQPSAINVTESEVQAILFTIEQKHKLNQSVSSTADQEQEYSRSASFNVKSAQERPPSLQSTLKQEEQKVQSPLDITEQKRPSSLTISERQSRSRSASLIQYDEVQNNPSLLSNTQQKKQTSETKSANIQEEHTQSHSTTPDIEEQEHILSSSSVTVHGQLEVQSSSSVTEHKNEEIRLSSPTIAERRQGSRSVSYIVKQGEEKSRTESVNNRERDEKMQSSPIDISKLEASNRLAFSTIQEADRIELSPLSVVGNEELKIKSSSSVTEEKYEETRLSAAVQENEQWNQLTSISRVEEHQKGQLISTTLEQEEEREQSIFPSTEPKEQHTRSLSLSSRQEKLAFRPSPIHVQGKSQKDPSPSPVLQEIRERNQPASPITERNYEQVQLFSPAIGEEQERCQTTSSKVREERRSRSTSPIVAQQQEEIGLLSSTIEETQQGSQSSPHIAKEGYEKNQSVSDSIESAEGVNVFSSSIINGKLEHTPSISDIIKQEHTEIASVLSIMKPVEELCGSSLSSVEQTKESILLPVHVAEGYEKNTSVPVCIVEQELTMNESVSPIMEKTVYRRESPSQTLAENWQENQTFWTDNEDHRASFLNEKPSEDILHSSEVANLFENEVESALKIQSADVSDREYEQQSVAAKSSIEMYEETCSPIQSDSSPIHGVSSQYSVQPSIVSSKHEENIHAQLLTCVMSDTESNVSKDGGALSMDESKEKDHSRLSTSSEEKRSNDKEKDMKPSKALSLTNEQKQRGNTEHKSTEVDEKRAILITYNESGSCCNPISLNNHRSSIVRSQSSFILARPNTFSLYPDDYDFDGLYTSNQHKDGHSDYHHNSARDTLTGENNLSSLPHENSVEQQHTSMSSYDNSNRLSVAVKSSTEGILYILYSGGVDLVLELIYSVFSPLPPIIVSFSGNVDLLLSIDILSYMLISFYLFIDKENNGVDPSSSKST